MQRPANGAHRCGRPRPATSGAVLKLLGRTSKSRRRTWRQLRARRQRPLIVDPSPEAPPGTIDSGAGGCFCARLMSRSACWAARAHTSPSGVAPPSWSRASRSSFMAPRSYGRRRSAQASLGTTRLCSEDFVEEVNAHVSLCRQLGAGDGQICSGFPRRPFVAGTPIDRAGWGLRWVLAHGHSSNVRVVRAGATQREIAQRLPTAGARLTLCHRGAVRGSRPPVWSTAEGARATHQRSSHEPEPQPASLGGR